MNERRWRAQQVWDVLVVAELVSDGGQVHGPLDDLPVSGHGSVVDGREEGPGVLVGLQLGQQSPGEDTHSHV